MDENIQYSSSSSSSEEGPEELDDVRRRPTSSEDDVFDYIDPDLYTGLMKDVLFNRIDEASKKIREGKSVRVVDNVGNSLLHLGVASFKGGNFDMVNFLLEQEDLDINAPNYLQRTPLLESIKRKETKLAIHLIERGAKIDIPKETPPLHEACKYGLEEVAKCIIERGADVNSLDRDGDTPLHVAVYHKRTEMVYLLLYYEAEMLENEELMTPFDKSLQLKATEITDILVDYASDSASMKLNMGVSFHHKNLPYYVERVIQTRRDDETTYLPSRDAWLRLQKTPHILKLILNNFYLERTFNSLMYDMFHCAQHNCGRLKRSLKAIMELDEDKITALTEEYHQLFTALIVINFRYKKPELDSEDIDFIEKFCLVLLSYGLPVFDLDLDVVYELLGYGDFFKTLLHMDFHYTRSPRYNPLSYCIFSTDYESTTQLKFSNIICMQLKKGLIQFVDIPHIRSFTKMACKAENMHIEEEKLIPFEAGIPKLTDLARNKARDVICKRFRITCSRRFYTLLNHACLPPKVKKLLCFEIPLYGFKNRSPEIRELNFKRMKTRILNEKFTPFATLASGFLKAL